MNMIEPNDIDANHYLDITKPFVWTGKGFQDFTVKFFSSDFESKLYIFKINYKGTGPDKYVVVDKFGFVAGHNNNKLLRIVNPPEVAYRLISKVSDINCKMNKTEIVKYLEYKDHDNFILVVIDGNDPKVKIFDLKYSILGSILG